MKLTPAVLCSLVNTPLNEVKEIKLIEKKISHIDDISCCVNLHRLDLSKNDFKSVDQLSGIKYCESLTWLKLAFNELENIDFLERLCNLITLNLSHNQLTRLTPHVLKCTKLKALILNHNNFVSVDNLESLTDLNSLILSHNKLSTPPAVEKLIHLTKLQLSHNLLREFPQLSSLENLKELSLHNNRITSIPSEIQYCPSLAILNIGNNLITRFEDIDVLCHLIRLRELTLAGNPISQENNYEEKVKSSLPRLKIFDNTRFDEKQKRKDFKKSLGNQEKREGISDAQVSKKMRYTEKNAEEQERPNDLMGQAKSSVVSKTVLSESNTA